MSSLYELSGQRLALQNKLESMNFDEETIIDTLEGESVYLQAKIENYGFVIQNRKSFLSAMDAEIERMTARRNAEAKRVENVEAWLLANMIGCGITKIECPAFTITAKTNPPSVDVLDEAAIPASYMRQPEVKIPDAVPDKKLILDALKVGLDVEGCAIKRITKLVIK